MFSGPKSRHDLDFLTAVERGEVITQMTLSKRLNIAVGLVNALLKRAMHKGYVKARQAPYKRYAYYLTPKGFAEKSRLVSESLESSLSFFRQVRSEYGDIFQLARKQGQHRLALFGNGELADIAMLAAVAEGVSLLAIVDPESNQDRRNGLTIVHRLAELDDVDAVVITDAHAPQQIYDTLRAAMPHLTLYAPATLRITQILTNEAETKPGEA